MKGRKREDKKVLAVIEHMLEVMHGGICITDGEGTILRLGESCGKLYGIDNSYVGKHVSVLEEEGIFTPSLTLIALKERRQVARTQPDKNGNPLLVTATPIFDPETGDLLYAISYASWDIKSMMDLQERYDQLKKEMERSSLELNALKRDLLSVDIVNHSMRMNQIVQLAEKVADVDVEVLITGEFGCGKSNLAKYIHILSNRKYQPFGQINCSAYSGKILEKELFGYVKINFKTGEEEEKAGLCEILNTGTLLLENIEGMDRENQSKLLHLLKNKSYYKRNGKEPVPADVRLIVTTRREARELVQFMDPDLFYRLTVVMMDMPSLKNRKEDIPYLVNLLLKQYNEKYQKKFCISAQAMELLEMYSWPGNITELKCLIQQLVLTVAEDTIQSYHLPDNISPFSASNFSAVVDLKEYLEYYEERLVLQAYDRCKTTVKLAKYLGISQASAVRKLQKYRLKAAED